MATGCHGAAAFGASHTTLIPTGDTTRVGDNMSGKVIKTRMLTAGNKDARIFLLGLNGVLNRACSEFLSSDQRGFLSRSSILTPVALCEAAMGEAAAVSREATGVLRVFANMLHYALGDGSSWGTHSGTCSGADRPSIPFPL